MWFCKSVSAFKTSRTCAPRLLVPRHQFSDQSVAICSYSFDIGFGALIKVNISAM